MNFRTSFALKAGLLLGVVVGSVGLSACGGGGGPSTPSGGSAPEIVITPPGGSAPEIVITPPANRAPMVEESIPVQTLTTGANARIVDVATYFMDPDNDQLTYSAVSDRRDIVEASMSDSMMTLTPVSAGTTTVTVTASDDHVDATQTIATMVQESEKESEKEPEKESEKEPEKEPENKLTGIRDIILQEGPQGRKTSMRMTLEPADAIWSGINFDIDSDDAGNMCCYQSFAESIYFKFVCWEDYNGDVTTTIIVRDPNGHTVKKSVSVTCR